MKVDIAEKITTEVVIKLPIDEALSVREFIQDSLLYRKSAKGHDIATKLADKIEHLGI